MRRKLRTIMLAAMIPLALALVPAAAEAQRGRPSGGRPGGTTVVVRGSFGSPVWGPGWGWGGWGWGWGWGPAWGWGWNGPFWGSPGMGWGPVFVDNSAGLRLEVKPKQAQVYVDGYYAGVVDDFNGTFQRLRLRPGDRELVLYLEGYKTVRQNIRLGARQEATVRFEMTPLASGETAEPPPQPKAAPPDEGNADNPPAEPRRAVPPQGAVEASAAQGQGFGSLVIRVQPSGSEVLIDGERWQGPEGSERLVIQVSAGAHKVDVRKEGSVPFSTTVHVRAGETVPLNVSLPPRGQ